MRSMVEGVRRLVSDHRRRGPHNPVGYVIERTAKAAEAAILITSNPAPGATRRGARRVRAGLSAGEDAADPTRDISPTYWPRRFVARALFA